MAEFEAKITGIADLSKAKQDFDVFKKSMEQPIKITVDTSGFNVVWGNLQKQVQQLGVTSAKQFNKGFENTLKTDFGHEASKKIISGWNSGSKNNVSNQTAALRDELGASLGVIRQVQEEIDNLNLKGLKLEKFKFNDTGDKFTAKAVGEMGQLVEITGRWRDAVKDASGEITNPAHWEIMKTATVDFNSGLKQAQTEAQKLATELDKISTAFSSGTFDANIAKMEQGLMGISNNVGSDLVKKASDAAAEYYRITQEITSSLNNPNQQGALQGQQLADAYKQAEVALKTYNNAMVEVRANTQKMLAEGVGARNANQVETWAKNNSKALKQYGDQLQDLANKMRSAQTQGELNGYINQFKNLKSEITAAGLGGLSFGDQIKKAFVHIGEFTGIYALTSQIRQIPREMVQEVIKIDTAMTELRKVSTASASEISSYFDQAADSAYKYGQTIDGIIESTASWTRLGYELKDATELADVTAELAQVGSGLNVDTATEGLQATIRGFSLAADEAKRVGDMINYVADTEPIDAIGIINGLERSSAAMSEANNSLEETIGLITATTSVTQDAASAGNAWRTKFKKRNCANVQKCA